MDVRNARWIHAIKTEERVRLAWYLKNREQLLESSKEETKKRVHQQDFDDIRAARKEIYAETERFPVKEFQEVPVKPETELLSTSVMKDVAPEITSLIYNSTNKGRITYLAKRAKELPEKRYYYPVTTSYNYGWTMWDCAKSMGGPKVGKSAIVRDTFYRRRSGVERDPDWYTMPERLSPTICNCN